MFNRERSVRHVLKNLFGVTLIFAISCAAATKAFSANELKSERMILEWMPFEYSFKQHGENWEDTVFAFQWNRSDMGKDRKTKGVELRTRGYRKRVVEWAAFQFNFSEEGLGSDRKPIIIAQYHGFPDRALGELYRNPVAAVVVEGGLLRYSYKASVEPVTPGARGEFKFSSSEEMMLGRPQEGWNTLVLRNRFDPTGHHGKVDVWFNGIHQSRRGPIGFNDVLGPYFKIGLYCPRGSDHATRTVLFRKIFVSEGCSGDICGMKREIDERLLK